MNTTYLIDLENVNSGGFEGANNLDETDELIVFYSEKADTLKIHIIRALLNTKAEIKFYKSKNGILNAMDFDIVSVLGIVYNAEREFVIVSKDKGFDVVVERYRSFGKVNVSRRINIGAAKQKTEPVQEQTTEPAAETELPAETEQNDTPAAEAADELIATLDEIIFSAPSEPEIEPDKFEAEISKAMEQTTQAQKTTVKKRGRKPKAAKAEPEQAAPVEEQAPVASEQPEPTPEVPAEPPAEKPKAKKPAAKKKKTATAEMSRLQKGKVNQFLNNLMGAKHKQPFTKEELTVIRETAAGTKNKTGFYNALRSKLGSEKGRELYQTVKDDYDKIVEFIKDVK